PFWLLMGDFSWIGSMYSARKGKEAADQGLAAQTEATDKALAQQQAQFDKTYAFNQKMYDTQQQHMEPWLAVGQGALNVLANGITQGGRFASTPTLNFDGSRFAHAPTFDGSRFANTPQLNFDPNSVNVLQDPGYKFRMQQGQDALTAGSAAAGNYGSGNLGVALQKFGQDYGSQEYGAAYNRAYTSALDQYNAAVQGQNTEYGRSLDQYNAAVQGQNTEFNRLSGIAGTGQVTASQMMGAGNAFAANQGALGAANSANASNLLVGMGNARAQGAIGVASAQSAGMTGAFNSMGANTNQLIGGLQAYNYRQNYQNNMQNQAAWNNYGVQPVDYGGGGNYQGTDMYAGDLY